MANQLPAEHRSKAYRHERAYLRSVHLVLIYALPRRATQRHSQVSMFIIANVRLKTKNIMFALVSGMSIVVATKHAHGQSTRQSPAPALLLIPRWHVKSRLNCHSPGMTLRACCALPAASARS